MEVASGGRLRPSKNAHRIRIAPGGSLAGWVLGWLVVVVVVVVVVVPFIRLLACLPTCSDVKSIHLRNEQSGSSVPLDCLRARQNHL